MKQSTRAEIDRLLADATHEQLLAIIKRLLEDLVQSPAGEREAVKWLRRVLSA